MPLLSLIAHLGLNKTGFDAGLNEAGKKVSKFGSDIKSQLAGAFTAAVVVGAVKHLTESTIAAAEAVGDLSDRLGISIKDAQDFALAAKLGGSDVEYFAQKIEKLRAYVAGGGDLSVFGIDTGDSVKALSEISKIIREVGLTAPQSVKFVEIFGKGSGKMINALMDLETAKQAVKFSDDEVRAAQDVSDSMVLAANAIGKLPANYITEKWIKPFQRVFGGGSDGAKPKTGDLDAIQKEMEARAVAQKEKENDAKGWMAIQDRIIDLEKEANDIAEKTRQAKLSDAGRLLEIKKKEAELQRKIDLEVPVTEDGIFREEYYRMKKQLAELGFERVGLESKRNDPITRIQPDEFGRIGAFTGAAAGVSQTALLGQQLNEIKLLRQDLVSRGILVKGTD